MSEGVECMSSKKNAEIKTPIQNAIRSIRLAWILAFVSAGITLIAALTAFMDILVVFDVAIVVVCAILLIILKSRAAAIVLLAHYTFSSIMMFIDGFGTPGMLFMRIAFIAAYFNGVLGAFAYQKLKAQENAVAHGSAGYDSAAGHGSAGQWGNTYSTDPRFAAPATPAIKEDTPGGKIVLAYTHENLNIAVKRAGKITELVVNGMVYAQGEWGVYRSHDFTVYVENALIKIYRDAMGATYIYVNGNLVKSK